MPTESTTVGQPTRVRWVVFGLACAASCLLYLHRYSWGVIKPFYREENPHVTDMEIGWMDGAFQAAYALCQLPGGLLGDLFGPRLVLGLSVLFWSVAATAVAWASGRWALELIRGSLGATQAGAYPVINKMTRTWFPLSIRSSVQGTVAACGRLGAACCPLVLATLLMGGLGLTWQTALLALMVPGLILAVILLVYLRNSPREHPLVNDAERRLIEGDATPATSETASRFPRLEVKEGRLSLGMMLVYSFASTFQDQLYVNWIPAFLIDAYGLSKTDMGLFTPLPLIGGALGGILGGVLNDYLIRRTGNRRWSRSVIALIGKVVQAGLVLWCVQAADALTAMALLFLGRVFGDWSLTTQWGAVTDMGGRAAATLFALANTLGALGGFAAGPVLGWLKQYYDWQGLFAGVALMCLVAGLAWIFIDCTRRLTRD